MSDIPNTEFITVKYDDKGVVDVCVDELRKVVTTPAYMLASSIKEVCEGADNMIKAMIKLI